MVREQIILACRECGLRNYISSKNKRTTSNRLELKKYCKHCRKHTIHKETK